MAQLLLLFCLRQAVIDISIADVRSLRRDAQSIRRVIQPTPRITVLDRLAYYRFEQ